MQNARAYSRSRVTFSSSLAALLLSVGTVTASQADTLPHLDLDMESAEYSRFLKLQEERFETLTDDGGDPSVRADLSRELEMGQRNLEFLKRLNLSRPDGQKLELTSPALQPGYPLESPRESNPALIRERYEALMHDAPEILQRVWSQGEDYPTQIDLSDEEYLSWARKADSVYQSAARWKLQEPYLAQYRARQAGDIRGYAFLMREPEWQSKVNNWSQLDRDTQVRLRPWIEGICFNTEVDARRCQSKFAEAEKTPNGVAALVGKYLSKSKSVWDSYFRLRGRRSDVVWTSKQSGLMAIPFKDPKDTAVKSFLLDNIEDEWKKPGWNLKLQFQTSGSWMGMPEIKFEPGATPHVNGLGGNTITMDANSPLTEYGTRWTIRHEFGHVLGLPDCYIEFLDQEREVMVSYQIDLDNLMCSRRGKFNELHFEELKKAYFRQ